MCTQSDKRAESEATGGLGPQIVNSGSVGMWPGGINDCICLSTCGELPNSLTISQTSFLHPGSYDGEEVEREREGDRKREKERESERESGRRGGTASALGDVLRCYM